MFNECMRMMLLIGLYHPRTQLFLLLRPLPLIFSLVSSISSLTCMYTLRLPLSASIFSLHLLLLILSFASFYHLPSILFILSSICAGMATHGFPQLVVFNSEKP